MLILLLIILSSSEVLSRTRLGLIGSSSGSQHQGSFENSSSLLDQSDMLLNYGYGAVLEIGITDGFGFEFSSILQSRGYGHTASLSEVVYDAQISTALMRFVFDGEGETGVYSIGLGWYYASSPNSNVKVKDVVNGTTTETNFDDGTMPLGALRSYDQGFVLAGSIDWPLSSWTSVMLDLRYLFGTENALLDQPNGIPGKWTEVSFVVGLSFNFAGISGR